MSDRSQKGRRMRLDWIGVDELSVVGLPANEQPFLAVKGSSAMGVSKTAPALADLDASIAALGELEKTLKGETTPAAPTDPSTEGQTTPTEKSAGAADPATPSTTGTEQSAAAPVVTAEMIAKAVSSVVEAAKATRKIVSEYSGSSTTTETIDIGSEDGTDGAMKGLRESIEKMTADVSKAISDKGGNADEAKIAEAVASAVSAQMAPVLKALSDLRDSFKGLAPEGNGEGDESGTTEEDTAKSKGFWDGFIVR